VASETTTVINPRRRRAKRRAPLRTARGPALRDCGDGPTGSLLATGPADSDSRTEAPTQTTTERRIDPPSLSPEAGEPALPSEVDLRRRASTVTRLLVTGRDPGAVRRAVIARRLAVLRRGDSPATAT